MTSDRFQSRIERLLEEADEAISAHHLPLQPATHTSKTAHIATSNHPTSFANGRYQFQKFLGEGVKKQVYLAHDPLLDRELAFALIKTKGLDDASRERIQQEAQAMVRFDCPAAGMPPHPLADGKRLVWLEPRAREGFSFLSH